MGRRGNVVAIQFRRPKGSPCARSRPDFSYCLVMVCVQLLIGENVSDIEATPSRNVDAFPSSIKIDSIHTFDSWKMGDLLT